MKKQKVGKHMKKQKVGKHMKKIMESIDAELRASEAVRGEAKIYTAKYYSNERYLAYSELWRATGVESRHSEALHTIEDGGEWSNTYHTVASKIGTGCLFALIGGRGTGKTQMAVMLAHVCCEKGKSAKYTRLVEFYMDIKASYDDGSKLTEREIIEQYCRPALLILDEAHERASSEWSSSLLNLLVDKRYAMRKDTIMIANSASAQEFSKSIGASISSRMNETGGIIECKWESFRK